jgi:hypothetical protein
MLINLGIGMPTLVPMFIPDEFNITMHVENGMLGVIGFPEPGQEDPDLINPQKETITVLIVMYRPIILLLSFRRVNLLEWSEVDILMLHYWERWKFHKQEILLIG